MRLCAFLRVLLLAGCAHSPRADAAGPGGLWDYRAIYEDGTLHITARLPPGSHLLIVDGARNLKGDCTKECTYDYDLGGDAARAVITTTPDEWLIRPSRGARASTYRLEVVTPDGVAFASGITPAGENVYQASAEDLEDGAYSAFGPFELVTLSSSVTLATPRDVYRAGIERWAARAVDGVARYYGRFPVPSAAILILPESGDDVSFGTARGGGGAAVQIRVGRDIDEKGLQNDWVLVHELLHFGFPNLPRSQAWWEEGLATYLECVVRARMGLRTEEQLWAELAKNLASGLEDGALNRSGSWASTYWGGAAFSFLADVMIRERTQGRKSLKDALRAIIDAGGNIDEMWSPRLVIETGDRATGVAVLAELWDQIAENDRPVLIVEAALAKLGVTERGLDDRAPWAAIRKAISR